jgi:hypothetical protein
VRIRVTLDVTLDEEDAGYALRTLAWTLVHLSHEVPDEAILFQDGDLTIENTGLLQGNVHIYPGTH